MKSIKPALVYLTGADFISERLHEEDELLRDATGIDNALPLDASPTVVAELYSRRLLNAAEYGGTMLLRLTGIDAIRKALR